MSTSPTLSPQDKMSAGRLVVERLLPYYTAALYSLVPVKVPGLGTMGITKTGVLMWDPDAVATWSIKQIATALVHEIGHLVRDHCHRLESCPDKKATNWAKDAEINDDLTGKEWEFPFAGIITPQLLGKPVGLTCEEYLSAAQQALQKQRDFGAGQGPSDAAAPQGPPQVGKGWCGSGAGRELPNEPDSGNGDPLNPQPKIGRSPEELEIIRHQVAQAVLDHEQQKGRGSVPAGVLRWAQSANRPSKIPWRKKIGFLARRALQVTAGSARSTYRKINRRQAGLGYGEGRPVLAGLEQPVPVVAIRVDTSGSMSEAELGLALSETTAILKTTGARIEFASCDCEMQSAGVIRRWQDAAALLKGGGGTSFYPIFEQLAAQDPRTLPDLVVIVTDGDGSCPPLSACPPGLRVIWLLVGHKSRESIEASGIGEIIEVAD